MCTPFTVPALYTLMTLYMLYILYSLIALHGFSTLIIPLVHSTKLKLPINV